MWSRFYHIQKYILPQINFQLLALHGNKQWLEFLGRDGQTLGLDQNLNQAGFGRRSPLCFRSGKTQILWGSELVLVLQTVDKPNKSPVASFFYVGSPKEDIFSGHHISPIFQSSFYTLHLQVFASVWVLQGFLSPVISTV